MTYRLPAVLIPFALLAACGEEPVVEATDNDGRTAAGEVIGGTISDAMLPLDSVRSQAPAAAEASDTGSGVPSEGGATRAGQASGEPASAAGEPEDEAEVETDEDAT